MGVVWVVVLFAITEYQYLTVDFANEGRNIIRVLSRDAHNIPDTKFWFWDPIFLYFNLNF